MLSLIYSDAIDNPIDGIIFPENPPEYKQEISFEKLEEARGLIAEEIEAVKKQLNFQGKFGQARKYVKLDYNKKEARVLEEPLDEQEQ